MSDKASYTAQATAVGGRKGHVKTDDAVVAFDLSMPKSFGGEGKPGSTNPEQLFACGYAACFGSAIDAIATAQKVSAGEITVTAEVTLNQAGGGFSLAARLRAHIAGVDRATAEQLVHKAHEICPYSKATRGNMPVELEVA